MNLNGFPTNETAIEMLGYVSQGFYDNSYVGKWLFQVMGLEIEDAKILFEELREQIYPSLATWGLVYHEQKYGLPTILTDSYEVRRMRILARMNLRGSMNPERLRIIAEGITGKECEVIENNAEYRFELKVYIISSDNEINEDVLYEKIKRIKPSHLAFDIITERPLESKIYVAAHMQTSEIINMRQVI